jgi:hypothetical protein
MVDDINFPKGLPPVSTAARVQKVHRKKRDEDKPPFEKFLDQKDEKKEKRNKESDKVEILSKPEERRSQNLIESSSTTDATEAQDDFDKKIIDVRV